MNSTVPAYGHLGVNMIVCSVETCEEAQHTRSGMEEERGYRGVQVGGSMDRGLEVVEGVEVVGWYRKYM